MTNELKNLEALRKYNILDTITEKEYDDITYLASTICNAPIALITFFDKERQWFKSHYGTQIKEAVTKHSFCIHAIQDSADIMIVEDSREDDRFRNNPLVTGDPNIVFYAGVPLVNKDGFSLGTVCILDGKTHKLNDEQINALKILSSQVMNMLELRRANIELVLLKAQLELRNKDLQQFAMVVSHDIKSPLASVMLSNEALLANENDANSEAHKLTSISYTAAKKIRSLVDGILSYYQGNNEVLSEQEIKLLPFFEDLEKNIQSPRKLEFEYSLESGNIFFNRTQLEQIFLNLFTNSSRYNKNEIVKIKIDYKELPSHYKFSISDNGIGIATEHHNKIFDLFFTLSARDSDGAKSSGIGLATIKKIVQTNGGEIRVESKTGSGTTVTFTLEKSNSN